MNETLEQLREVTKALPKILGDMKKELVKEGFTPEEAYSLVSNNIKINQ